jgi:hypothetical protein
MVPSAAAELCLLMRLLTGIEGFQRPKTVQMTAIMQPFYPKDLLIRLYFEYLGFSKKVKTKYMATVPRPFLRNQTMLSLSPR